MHIFINHLNKAFQDAKSGAERQSINEHLIEFKGGMYRQQYMKNKPIKWCFKYWDRCYSKTRYLYGFDLYLAKRKKAELGETVALDLSKKLENIWVLLNPPTIYPPTHHPTIHRHIVPPIHRPNNNPPMCLCLKDSKTSGHSFYWM